MPSDRSRMIDKVKFSCFPLWKAFVKQRKAIENQGGKQVKAIEEHWKQLAESNAVIRKYDIENVHHFLNRKKYLLNLSLTLFCLLFCLTTY